jgi:uncharacterized DUF497 family protein
MIDYRALKMAIIRFSFEWDSKKATSNKIKHGVDFQEAQKVFRDPYRVIVFDSEHSLFERRYYCLGKIDSKVLTVRFTLRNSKIRIFGVGYWRKGKKLYEKKNKVH